MEVRWKHFDLETWHAGSLAAERLEASKRGALWTLAMLLTTGGSTGLYSYD